MKISDSADYSKGVHAVLNTLDLNQVPFQIREFDVPAHHASQAADLLDCPLGAVVKSLVFQRIETESMVLVLVSGKNRVNIQALTDIVGQPVRPANPEDVLNFTGYPVGSVPPIGLINHGLIFSPWENGCNFQQMAADFLQRIYSQGIFSEQSGYQETL
jgi:hypothetical protein